MRKWQRQLFLWGNTTAGVANLPMSIWTINSWVLSTLTTFYNIWICSTEHKTPTQCHVVNFEGILKIVFDAAQGRALTSPWPGRPLLPRSVCLQGPAKVKFSIKSFDSYLSSEIYLSSSPSPGSLQGTEERSDLCSKRFQFLHQSPQDLQTWCER